MLALGGLIVLNGFLKSESVGTFIKQRKNFYFPFQNFNSFPSFLFLNSPVSFKIQNFHSSILCDLILCYDFSKFIVTEDRHKHRIDLKEFV